MDAPAKLPKGTVIGHRPCVGCTSNQPVKITKTGGACLICGMCSTRLFFGAEPSGKMIAKYLAGQKAPKVAAEPKPAPPPNMDKQEPQKEGHWYYG